MKVAVVGGGFAGVACATALAQAGVKVSLWEKAPHLGGLAAGFRTRGWQWSLEHYYHHWFRSDTWVQRFARTWGVTDKLRFHRPITVSETESHGFVQLDSPISLLRYPELPLHDKLRMGMVLAYIKTLRDWRPLEQHSAVEWCTRTMGKRGFDAIWRPLLVGKFGEEHVNKVNMAWFWSRLACRTPELGTYEGGFADLFVDVEKWLTTQGVSVHKGVGDLDVRRLSSGWQIAAQGEVEEFSHLVVASGPGTFRQLCGEFAPDYVKEFARRPALGVQVVILALRKQLGSPYWYSLRKSSERPFLALIEHTNFVDRNCFSGEHIVYLADYVSTESAAWSRSDAELKTLALQTCQRVNSQVSASDLLEAWVFRDAYAQPVMPLNASRDLPAVSVPGVQNLFHASMNHVYPWDRGTNFALELGHRAAEGVMKSGRGY